TSVLQQAPLRTGASYDISRRSGPVDQQRLGNCKLKCHPVPTRRTRWQWKTSRRFPEVRERNHWSTNSRELGLRTSSSPYRSFPEKQSAPRQRCRLGEKNPEP